VVLRQVQNKLAGLTSKEAALRLEKFGSNELRKQKNFPSLRIFFNQFRSPLIYILVLAGLATLLLRHFTDTIIIFLTLFINVVLGFYQEQKSQKSMTALRSLVVPVTKVVRDGQTKIIATKDLVPGDLVILTIGTHIPADGFLVESTDLTVNEAILTGESQPATKKASPSLGVTESAEEKQNQIVFMGTSVITGIGKIIVTKTGMATRIGGMGKLVMELIEEKTPLQIQIGQMAKKIAWLIGITAFLIFLFGKFLGYETFQIFTISIAVALAAMPEGLIATLTVILSLGMQRILKRKALVRHLLATETLGSVNVICADKTGTLTEGRMRVVESVTSDQRPATREKLIEATILCNDMRDPLEVAMMAWALRENQEEPISKDKLLKKYKRLDEIPFNPTYKYIATLHSGDKKLLFLSGAPEVILAHSKLTKKDFQIWQEKLENYGQKGYRLVGFAYQEVKDAKTKIENSDLKGLQWLGILIYEDPIRQGVKKALEQCQKAGIDVKIITGDYVSTSLAVLKKLGFEDHQKVLEGKDLEKMNFEELKKVVGKILLFARTTPEQKLKIVQALKENGEVVAMMGDGVNDAPALKKADIGIVVEGASDLAKENADMVLLDSNFTTIVQAVEEGRLIFENIKKANLYLFSHSFVEIILIGSSLLFRLPLPITAAQILWINMFQDTLPAIALAFEGKEEGLMSEPPRHKETPIIDTQIKILLLFIGIISPIFLTTLVIASLKGFLPFHFSQTLIFTALGVISMFVVFACRSLRQSFRYDLRQNPSLIGALLASLSLLLMAIYLPPFQLLLQTQPLGFKEWLWVVMLGILNLLALELIKQFLFLRKSHYFERSEKQELPYFERREKQGLPYFERREKQGLPYFERSEKQGVPL